MLLAVCLTFLQNATAYLPYVLVGLFVHYLIRNLVLSIRKRRSSDLDSIPGPFVPWWQRYTVGHNVLYHVLSANAFNTAALFNSWRRDHGPIYQLRSLLGERIIITTSEEAIRTVHITKWRCFVKPQILRDTFSSLVGENGILLVEGESHTRLRKAVAPAMHYNALARVGTVFLEEGKVLAKRLAKLGDEGGDVLREVRISTFAVIFQSCFGNHAASPELVRKLQEAYLAAFLEPPWHALLTVLLQKCFWFVGKQRFVWRNDLRRYIRQTIYQLCEEREQHLQHVDSESEAPLLSLMIDEETKKTLTNEEMVDTVLSFLTAGQLTTSLAVAWTLYILARESKWQERLCEELRSWSAEDGLDALDRLPLLNRIIRESIRLYPPVFYVSRETADVVEIDGFKLPKGVGVRLPVLAIHRNEDIWGPDVHEFNPDRFLHDHEVARTKMFWCVFLFGAKSCIGQRFALLEIKAFVAQVLAIQRVFLKPFEDEAPTSAGLLATPINMKIYFQSREAL